MITAARRRAIGWRSSNNTIENIHPSRETDKPRPHFKRVMSLRQQIKKLTREIRQRKDQRRRLRQALQQNETLDKGRAEVEARRQELKSQAEPVTVMDWSKLVQFYVKKVLGHDSFVCHVDDSGDDRYIRWSSPLPDQYGLEHHCISVDERGYAVALELDNAGNVIGETNDDCHLFNDSIKDWPCHPDL